MSLATTVSGHSLITKEEALSILQGEVPLMQVVEKASKPRFQFFGNTVRIHILDNIKNGFCPEDCGYCAQRKNGNSEIQEYSTKDSEEIFQDAVKAKANGAYRFCMVTSGTGPTEKSIAKLTETIHRISTELGMKVCLSAGILKEGQAERLQQAGLDRYNHNLNTSSSHYGEICTTHDFQDRVSTLQKANKAGIGLCSGVIVGMGEQLKDIVEVAFELRALGVVSIPVNFFIPIKGHAITNPNKLTPELCVRILSIFRLINPDAEIRMAAGREGHLRGMETLGLFVANSLFADGYLNVRGSSPDRTMDLIRDAGMIPEFPDGIPEGLENSFEDHLYSKENITSQYKYKKILPNS